MLRMLEAQAPAKQKATVSIGILGGRLNSSTLLEDRRAAILGLRSFAKEYPASVASEALRGLISSLSHDVEDVDTIKIVLETLLMLFNPDSNSVSSLIVLRLCFKVITWIFNSPKLLPKSPFGLPMSLPKYVMLLRKRFGVLSLC